MKRRNFFRLIVSILGISAISAFPFLINNKKNNSILPIAIDINSLKSRVNFVDKFIIIKNQKKEYTVLQSVCTHMGCTINYFDGVEIICHCHGSHFDLDGNVVKGPASAKLKKLKNIINENKLLIFNSIIEKI